MTDAERRRLLRDTLAMFDCDLVSDGEAVLLFCVLCHESAVYPDAQRGIQQLVNAAEHHANTHHRRGPREGGKDDATGSSANRR